MSEGELSDSSGGRHPAEDLIIQKALLRTAAASDVLSPPVYEQVSPANPPGLELSPDEGPPPGIGALSGSREGSAPALLDGAAPAKKRNRKQKAGGRAREQAKAQMAENLQRHLARVASGGGGTQNGGAHANGGRQYAAEQDDDLDGGSLHSSDSEEAGIALGNAPDVARGAKRRKATPPAPVGVRVIGDDEDAGHAPEVARLLRQPRYFDEDYEAATLRCFKCGGQGHMSRECPHEQRARPCYLRSQFGRTRAQCTNVLCFRCNQPGHLARECPNGRALSEHPPMCLRCGREDCPAAEGGDYIRAEGGCTQEYLPEDLAQAVCLSCGQRGHLSCAAPDAGLPAYKPSCCNCGQRGHTGEECWKGRTAGVENERRGARRAAAANYSDLYLWSPVPDSTGWVDDYGDYGDRWQGGPGSGADAYRGGGTYAQRVSRLSARSADSPQRRGRGRREHLRWGEEEEEEEEEEEDEHSYEEPPSDRYRPQGRRYGRR